MIHQVKKLDMGRHLILNNKIMLREVIRIIMRKWRKCWKISAVFVTAFLLMACGKKDGSYNDVEEEYADSDSQDSYDEEVEEEIIQNEDDSEIRQQLLEAKFTELQTTYGLIDESNYSSEKQGVSNIIFCDVNADDVEELLAVYIDGDFSGEYDSASVWAVLYGFEDDEIVQIAEQQIVNINYCDAMTVRLFFSEQQAAYCIVTAKELIGAYTGAREFVSELYKVSENEITLRRHWSQNSVENPGASQDDIISEMRHVGIPYMNLNYFSYEADDAASVNELLLLQNTVSVEGEDAAERSYELNFTTYEELNTQNGDNKLLLTDEERNLLLERSEGVQETELKASAREAIQVIDSLLAGRNGVTVDFDGYIDDLGTSDGWCPVVNFSTTDEIKAYVRSMVSDNIYIQYYHGDSYMERDGILYIAVSTYDAYMDMASLEIEKVEGDIYTVSIDEYLGHTLYVGTDLITLQKNGDGWFALGVSGWTGSGISKGYTNYYGESSDFLR
ncbi:MAG: hypothetical protein LUC98_11435 [Lachnospiraceae bacterium]|nr:hypothetical protein [Lachnospiraceae bacterium]